MRPRVRKPPTKPDAQGDAHNRYDGDLPRHILPTSGTMVGVCTTLVGLVKLGELQHGASHVDEYAACAAVLFMLSASLSYLSIRSSQSKALSGRLEAIADIIFMVGLAAISVISLLFAYELI
jgi:hypothetical protein